MHVASLELCKGLYAVSGWDDEQLDHHVYSYPNSLVNNTVRFPMYTLDYLLDKLPHFIELVQMSGGYTPTGWRAIKRSSQDYWHRGGPIEAEADNPTDAAAKLCIELIKQGILTPERK